MRFTNRERLQQKTSVDNFGQNLDVDSIWAMLKGEMLSNPEIILNSNKQMNKLFRNSKFVSEPKRKIEPKLDSSYRYSELVSDSKDDAMKMLKKVQNDIATQQSEFISNSINRILNKLNEINGEKIEDSKESVSLV